MLWTASIRGYSASKLRKFNKREQRKVSQCVTNMYHSPVGLELSILHSDMVLTSHTRDVGLARESGRHTCVTLVVNALINYDWCTKSIDRYTAYLDLKNRWEFSNWTTSSSHRLQVAMFHCTNILDVETRLRIGRVSEESRF